MTKDSKFTMKSTKARRTDYGEIPAKYRDCNKNFDKYQCAALVEKLCVTRGRCKFYKSDNQEDKTDKTE